LIWLDIWEAVEVLSVPDTRAYTVPPRPTRRAPTRCRGENPLLREPEAAAARPTGAAAETAKVADIFCVHALLLLLRCRRCD